VKVLPSPGGSRACATLKKACRKARRRSCLRGVALGVVVPAAGIGGGSVTYGNRSVSARSLGGGADDDGRMLAT
jgi:hypothetical protein